MPGTSPQRKVTQPVHLRLVKDFGCHFLPLKMGTRFVRFLVDTGACWTLMSLEMIEQCGLKDSMEIHEVGLASIGVLGAEAEAEGGYLLNFVVAVMQRLDTPLLGMNFLLRYGCLLVLDPEFPLLTVRPKRPVEIGFMCSVYKKCLLSKRPVTAMLDTGSTHSFISRALAKELKLKKRLCRPMLVTLFDGRVTVMFRKVRQAEVNIDGLRFVTDVIIHPNENVSLILGMNILSASRLCLEKKEILLCKTNPQFVGGEQNPKPSLVSLIPPQFSVFSSSGRIVSSATGAKRGFLSFKKWFKFLRCFKGSGSERYDKNDSKGSCSDQELSELSASKEETETGSDNVGNDSKA